MLAEKRNWRRKTAALALGTAAMVGGVVGLSTSMAGATNGECGTGPSLYIEGGTGIELYDVFGHDVAIFDLKSPLSAGTYDVTAFGYDGYIGRGSVPADKQEKSERWYVEFLDADGAVVGHTPPTTDLADDSDHADSLDTFNDIVLRGTATQVRIILMKDFLSLDLVHVSCLGFDRHVDPTTTTTEATTTTTGVTSTTRDGGVADTTTTAPAPTTASTLATTTTVTGSVKATTLPFTGDHTAAITVAGIGTLMLGFALVRRSRQLA